MGVFQPDKYSLNHGWNSMQYSSIHSATTNPGFKPSFIHPSINLCISFLTFFLFHFPLLQYFSFLISFPLHNSSFFKRKKMMKKRKEERFCSCSIHANKMIVLHTDSIQHPFVMEKLEGKKERFGKKKMKFFRRRRSMDDKRLTTSLSLSL